MDTSQQTEKTNLSIKIKKKNSEKNDKLVTKNEEEENIEEEGKEGEEYFIDDLDEKEWEKKKESDPLYYWNIGMFYFNDFAYKWIFDPIVSVYKAFVPEVVRTGIRNFLNNLAAPFRFIWNLLQGKIKEAFGELGRFFVNTTVGFLGFMNVVRNIPDLNPPEEDLGQTLGKWGIGEGWYVIWPFLGPSTFRDTLGTVGEIFMSPIYFIEPKDTKYLLWSLEKVSKNMVDDLDNYNNLIDLAVDPYEAVKDAYLQNRRKNVSE